METLGHDGRELRLVRLPRKENDRLRAWDAADEYLLREFGSDPALASGRLLVANDAFGALGVALHLHSPTSWGDSHLASQALIFNLGTNGIAPAAVAFVPSTSDPEGPFDLALVKLPRSLAFLEEQLWRLRPLLAPDARVVLGGMIKHTPKRAWQLLEEIIGPARTTLGWKKSRLGVADFAARPDAVAPENWQVHTVPELGLELGALPNVFSRERLDLGTRVLLGHLPRTDAACDILDLGCGNGVLALAMARSCPAARVHGVDESHQAVASARRNADQLGADTARLTFAVADGAADLGDESVDIVVCNPPFHQGSAVGDLAAWTMFTGARRVLRPGGELRLVGNRHLGYHAKLKRLFDTVDVVGSQAKFVVLSARA